MSKAIHNPKARVSVGDIAEMAGVRPSAVSNWRRRHKDFPLPVEQATGGDLFELGSVISWLEQKGKDYTLPAGGWERLVWRVRDHLRGDLRVEEAFLLLLQLLLIRSRADLEKSAEAPQLREAWDGMVSAPERAVEIWVEMLNSLKDNNPDLARALGPAPKVNRDVMAAVVATVSEIKQDESSWGALTTTLLERLHADVGIRGAEYHTPESLTSLMIRLLSPIEGTVYDPACGSAMFLAAAWRERAARDLELVGQDVNEYSWRLGYLNLALHGAEFRLDTGDTLRDDRFRSLRADRVAIDPPLGAKPRVDEFIHDDRWAFGVPTRSTDWLWAQHGLYHLSEDGIGVIVMPPAALFGRGTERRIREGILEGDLIDAVIDLPPGMIAGTQTSISLLIFAANRRSRRGQVLFIDGRQLGHSRRGKPHELQEKDIQRILSTVEAWRSGAFKPEPRFSASARMEQIIENGADLSPRRYVQYVTQVSAIDGEPIPERYARLAIRVQDQVPSTVAALENAVSQLRDLSHQNEVEWPVIRLGDLLITDPQTGTRYDPDGDHPAVPYIETGEVSGGVGYLNKAPESITRGNTRGRLVRRGDVLLVSRGIGTAASIGCATVAFDGEAAYSESLLRLSPDPDRLDPDYLRLFLTSRQGRTALAAATTGSVIANLRAEALVEIEIRLPDPSTQREIAVAMQRIEGGIAQIDAFRVAVEDTMDTIREGVAAGFFVPSPQVTDSQAEGPD